MLWQYQCIIPHLWSFQVGHLTFSDKHVQTYSLATLLAFSQPTSSLFASSLGIVVSALYRSNGPLLSGLKQWRIPVRIYRILSLLLSPWIGSTRLPQRSWRAEPPMRRTLQAREARLAEHNAAVANLSRERGGVGALGGSRIASLLRRRAAAADGAAAAPSQGQDMAGVVQQRPPPAQVAILHDAIYVTISDFF
ncbi:hypothetical protein [Sporisorium scitamineum]|uniref:Uncharacterized protein n=1 Tax=Sporisorium scitamineum TaxID=49012 RepID=A0A0F7RY06_9BASI|nr:hypothetical protein [Sporisorium scitamineum]